jgi:cation:H+ antiporter
VTFAILLFLACGAIIVVAGVALTSAADAIAERTGLGRLWIGAVLLAAATSLPELTADVAAVRLGAADLAAGDLFGSSMANMVILALIGFMRPCGMPFREATLDHALTATLAIALNCVAAVFVLTRPEQVFAGVSPASVLLVLGFGAGMRVVYRNGKRTTAAPATVGEAAIAASAHAPGTPPLPDASAALTLRAAALRFGVATVVIVAAAPLLASAAQRIAELSGLGATFVGTWLVGISTSLPEVVSSVAAVRLGAIDLAVGSLFGSNGFNMVVFFAMDLAHPAGSIFGALSAGHALSALFATVLMALGLATIAYRAEHRYALLEPGSVLMIVVYVLGLWTLYQHTVAH